MKVMTVLGTRPEIIRLSRIVPALDSMCDHVFVHTGQNFDQRLSDIFFSELAVRAPDHYLGVRGESFGDQIGQILVESEQLLRQERPDRLLILGDTNSGLAAIMAARLRIPVYHMEAGNRCYDDRVPEEVNRRIIDHCSTVLMPYTYRSQANLLREGIEGNCIYVTGNPIKEVLDHYGPQIAASDILPRLGLESKVYFLVTLHRAENVDISERLQQFVMALQQLQQKYQIPMICSIHPRTRARLGKAGIQLSNRDIRLLEPLGFFDFVRLEQEALCVLSDSGTVQEECCLFHVPTVTLRDVTERPETLDAGSNMLSGADPEQILRSVQTVLASPPNWTIPPEYQMSNVSQTVLKLVLGFR